MSTVDPGQISESMIDSLPEPQLADNATTVLNKRYLRRDDDGVPIESIKQMFFRVANHIGETEIEVKEYYNAMINGEWMPNTPTLFNAGTNNGLGLSACYVVVPQDSLESICQAKTDLMMIQKSGGGVGYPFDNLRPRGTIVKSCGATTDGPIPFITTFCEDTNAIQQGAKRRGAQMGMLRIDHPDIWDFIHHKEDGTKWQNMNISPKVTSEFMQLIDADDTSAHKVQHPKWGEGCIIQNEETGKVKSHNKPHEIPKGWSTVTINQIFNRITELAWKNGEPGLAFWDRVEKDWVFKKSGKYRIVSTNPCGEIPLEDGGSCNLASINIAHMYKDGEIDWAWFADKVAMVVRFLDGVVEVNEFPVEKIAQVNKETRRIGVGIMGFADLLFQLEIPYDSKEAQDLASKISYELSEVAYNESKDLAAVKGSFLAWEDSDYALESNEFEATEMRNAYRTMIAPTGTISIIANCSASIEPIFSLAFNREVMADADGKMTKMQEVNPYFHGALAKVVDDHFGTELTEQHGSPNNVKYNEVIDYVSKNGTLRNFDGEISKANGWGHLVEVFQTARDVSMEGHVLMQAAWQKHLDQACSKTINLPEEATIKDVRKAYMLAWENGCKGITVYRDNSREGVAGQTQPMKLAKKTDKTIENLKVDLGSVDDWFPEDNLTRGEMAEVPDICEAIKIKQNTPIGKIHVNVVHEGGDIKEIWGQIGKPGDQPSADAEAICRLASLVLRLGGDIDMVLKQLEHIGSSLLMPTAEGKIMSIPDGIAVAIKRARREIQNSSDTSLTSSTTNRTIRHRVDKVYAEVCPDCGGKLHRNSGCVSCPSCGHSRC